MQTHVERNTVVGKKKSFVYVTELHITTESKEEHTNS